MANTTRNLLLGIACSIACAVPASADLIDGVIGLPESAAGWFVGGRLDRFADDVVVAMGPGGHTNQDRVPEELDDEHTNQDREPPPPPPAPVIIRRPPLGDPTIGAELPQPWSSGFGIGPELSPIPLAFESGLDPAPIGIAAFGVGSSLDGVSAFGDVLGDVPAPIGIGLQSVPAPSALPLLALGLLGGRRRRRA